MVAVESQRNDLAPKLVSDRAVVMISEEAWEVMVEVSKSAYPNEGGGVIVGSLIEGHEGFLIVNVSRASTSPPDSKASPDGFTRGMEGLEEYLADQAEAGFEYLGEWHSHPTGKNGFSDTDDRAMELLMSHTSEGWALLLVVAGAYCLGAPDVSGKLYGKGEAVTLSRMVHQGEGVWVG